MAARKSGTSNKMGGGKKENTVPTPATVAKDQVKHHSKSQYTGAPPPRNIQQPRISTTIPPSRQSTFADPNSASLHGAFNSPHLGGGGQPHQQSPYGGASQDPSYYASHPSPHSTASASGHYPTAEGSEQMAATAHMQRPYPPIYHTPQSNSPASVASPQTHDQHGRSMYGQPPPQLTQPIQPMYAYPQYSPMSQVHTSQYTPHSGQQPHHPMSHHSMMQHPSSNATIPQQQPMGQPGGMTSSSPRLRVDPMQHQQQPQQQIQQQQQPQQPQQPPQQATPRMMQQHTPTQPSSIAANNVNIGQTAPPAINPSAAPGPIPATTPLVVRQDGNGVQWIAFEYSRDRVKSEYTIRCDVESVNVDSLSAEFKNENCVYPRACCGKENYKGNRLNYETECNAVGWALAELNTCLRGKRGLIQRAVDSWRNSNQDPRLRSRRVRRQAKVQHRNKTAQQAGQMAGPSPTGVAGVTAGMGTTGIRAPTSAMGSMGAPQLQHHHHARPEMSAPGQQDSSAEVDYSSASGSASAPRQQSAQSHPISTPTDLRPGQVFTGYPAYPPTSAGGSSMAPSSYNPMDALGRPGGPGTMISAPTSGVRETPNALGDFLPESRKRKIEEVDSQQPGDRIRLGLQFNHEGGGGSSISPTSYRTYADFPRSSYPSQMPAPATAGQLRQKDSLDEENPSTIVRTALEERQLEHTMDDHTSFSLGDSAEEKKNSRSYGYRLTRDRMRQLRHGLDQPQFIGVIEQT